MTKAGRPSILHRDCCRAASVSFFDPRLRHLVVDSRSSICGCLRCLPRLIIPSCHRWLSCWMTCSLCFCDCVFACSLHDGILNRYWHIVFCFWCESCYRCTTTSSLLHLVWHVYWCAAQTTCDLSSVVVAYSFSWQLFLVNCVTIIEFDVIPFWDATLLILCRGTILVGPRSGWLQFGPGSQGLFGTGPLWNWIDLVPGPF
jgi:hypothetical protein